MSFFCWSTRHQCPNWTFAWIDFRVQRKKQKINFPPHTPESIKRDAMDRRKMCFLRIENRKVSRFIFAHPSTSRTHKARGRVKSKQSHSRGRNPHLMTIMYHWFLSSRSSLCMRIFMMILTINKSPCSLLSFHFAPIPQNIFLLLWFFFSGTPLLSHNNEGINFRDDKDVMSPRNCRHTYPGDVCVDDAGKLSWRQKAHPHYCAPSKPIPFKRFQISPFFPLSGFSPSTVSINP